ncbi:hypothetical protein BGX38DRAFT_501432 [Terfezia claveryi]|nr:hypothetical protein BGX38DRAFT_501432 [Terfezia claveryi]
MYYLVTTWDGLLWLWLGLGEGGGAGHQLGVARKEKKKAHDYKERRSDRRTRDIDTATKVIPRSTPISRSRRTDNVCVTSHDGEFHFTSKRLSITTGISFKRKRQNFNGQGRVKCSLQCLASCLFIPLYDSTPLRSHP